MGVVFDTTTFVANSGIVIAAIVATSVSPSSGFAQRYEPLSCGDAYTVEDGDTISSIAARLSGVEPSDIVASNPDVVRDVDLIFPGAVLQLPCPTAAADRAASRCTDLGMEDSPNMPKLSEDLCRRFDDKADQAEHTEQVIITLSSEADRSVLKQSGITIVSEMRNVPVVVAAITASGLQALAASSGVVRVELDSADMRALDN